MKKIISAADAASFVKEGSRVMVGGFLSCGCPKKIVGALAEQKTKNLTMISNDTSTPGITVSNLIANKQVKKLIAAHIGTNPETGVQMNAGELEVELVPMGTFVERMHAFGAGLGGVLTPTGIGTLIEQGKKTMEIEGKKFILEKPIGADVALIYGTKVDKFGNVSFYGSTRNFNTTMASAAETVIVEADEIVDCLDPNEVVIPGVFIDFIVDGGAN